MKSVLSNAAFSVALILGSAGVSSAQATAIAEANARLVCGTGVVVNAVYLPGGLLQATCQSPSQGAAGQSTPGVPAALAGTGLSAGAVAGIAAGALLLVVVGTGGDGEVTTQTAPVATTTTTSSTATGK